MNFEPLFNASLAIQLHVAFALVAVLLGGYVLWARKRGLHKLLGRLWVGAMVLVALTSFFISSIKMFGPFSPIHILSIITLVGLWRAVAHIRDGNISAHQRAMKSLYFGALITPGILNFIPGRTMYEVFFGQFGRFWAESGPMPIVNIVLGVMGVFFTMSLLRYLRNRKSVSP